MGDHMTNPMVSIGIPSYNHEKYISKTIDSILNQTFQDFEIIITDDGSSDKTVAKIKEFSDPRIKLHVFKQNEGACKALNNCIINSKGKYFSYISSDDVWEHDKLEKQVKYLDENPLTPAVFTKVKIIDEDGKEFTKKDHPYSNVFKQENRSRSEWLNHFFYVGNCICHPSIMIRKDVYKELGLYNGRMANLPDFDMWVRLCLKYDFHILDEELTKFRVRKDEKNVSGTTPTAKLRYNFERLHIFDHYLKIDDTEFFKKIFPDAHKFGKLKANMIPYFLAKLAYETNIDLMQLWALNTLYNFMQSNEIVDQLRDSYDFYYPDFIKMSGKSDFSNIYKISQMEAVINSKNRLIHEKEATINRLIHEKEATINRLIHEKDMATNNRDHLIHEQSTLIMEKNLKIDDLIHEKEATINRLIHEKDMATNNRDHLIHEQSTLIMEKNLKIDDLIHDKNEESKILNSQIESLFEIQYRSNYKRSIGQRFFSKFPSLHILLNRNNTSFKNALINIKGYKAIQKNKIFNIGYYLKNNPDIRVSGVDPLIHYIYHGFKEGRKPNPNFDGKYYLQRYSDVQDSNLNPMVHYSLFGIKEDRKIIRDQEKYGESIINSRSTDPSSKQKVYRIAIIIKGNYGEFSPTSYVRLLLPLKHNYFNGKILPFIITDNDLKEMKEEFILNNHYDCCIVQRDVLGDLKLSEIIVKKCKEKNIGLIYEIDDDLLNIEKSHPEYEFYSSRNDSVLYLLKNADMVTVSTDVLKKRFQKYNKHVKVIGNALDESLWCKKSDKKSDGTIKIGYIGSFTHDNDLLVVKDAIINLKKSFANKIKIEFYVIGIMKNSSDQKWLKTIDIPHNKHVYPEFVKWLKKIVNFDLALAPLDDNNINKSKSELKYLEYTALGIPGVYSDNGPFSKVITNEINGLLVKGNTSENWEQQISKLIEDSELYHKILDDAKKDVKENYLLKNRVKEWDNLLFELIEGK